MFGIASVHPAGSVPTHTPPTLDKRLQKARCTPRNGRRWIAVPGECPQDDTPSGREQNDKERLTNWLAHKLAQTLSDDHVGVFDAQLENVRI